MKYSIIVPTYNSVAYVKDTIDSIVTQNFDDYELIVSDNVSEDETYAYVASLKHPRIRLIQPHKHLIMAEHWEFAIAKAQGDWIAVVGSDDGLMPHFFALAEFFTAKAQTLGIELIGSQRAYFFWEGCQNIYGDINYSYSAKNAYTIRPSYERLLRALICENEAFFSLPHMYTSSLVHKSLLAKIRKKQNFQLITSLTPDSSLACSLLLESHQYLHSFIPFGIVGAASRSTGIKYSLEDKESLKTFTSTKHIHWHTALGNAHDYIHSVRLHLYESLLSARLTRHTSEIHDFLHSYFLKKLVFSALYKDIMTLNTLRKKTSLKNFEKLLTLNNISMNDITTMQNAMLNSTPFIFHALYLSEHLHTHPIFPDQDFEDIEFTMTHTHTDCHCLMDYWFKVQSSMKALI